MMPRLSIVSVMAVVIVVAIDCLALRAIDSRNGLAGALHGIALGSLPMVNLLAVGLTLILQERRKSRPFLVGFEVFGMLALLLFIAGARVFPDAINSGLISVADTFADTSARLGLDYASTDIGSLVEEVCLVPVLLLLPQLSFALAGGWLTHKFMTARSASPDEAASSPEPLRLRPRSLLVLLILSAIPALAIEVILRETVDPRFARLEAGSTVVLDDESSTGFYVNVPNGSAVIPVGTRFQVVGDDAPSVIGPITKSRGRGPLGDLRAVRVTIIGGEWAGSPTMVYRCLLRAAH